MPISDPALYFSSLQVSNRPVTDSAANFSSLQLKKMLICDLVAYLMLLQLYTLINTMRKDPRPVMDSFATKYLLLAQGGNDVGEAFAELSSVMGKSRVVDEAFLSMRCVRDDGQAEEAFVESMKVRAFACCTRQTLRRITPRVISVDKSAEDVLCCCVTAYTLRCSIVKIAHSVAASVVRCIAADFALCCCARAYAL